MGQVTTIGQIQAHNSTVWTDDASENGEISRWSGIGLNIAAPFVFVESKFSNLIFFQRLIIIYRLHKFENYNLCIFLPRLCKNLSSLWKSTVSNIKT